MVQGSVWNKKYSSVTQQIVLLPHQSCTPCCKLQAEILDKNKSQESEKGDEQSGKVGGREAIKRKSKTTEKHRWREIENRERERKGRRRKGTTEVEDLIMLSYQRTGRPEVIMYKYMRIRRAWALQTGYLVSVAVSSQDTCQPRRLQALATTGVLDAVHPWGKRMLCSLVG